MQMVCGLARHVALQRDRDRAVRVSDISSDILDSMYRIRFQNIYRLRDIQICNQLYLRKIYKIVYYTLN